MHAAADATQVAKAIKVDIEIARARARAASAIVWAIGAARNGQIDNARAALTAAEASARDDAARLHDPELVTLAGRMADVAGRLAVLSRIRTAAVDPPAPSLEAVAAPVEQATARPELRKDGKPLALDNDGEQLFRGNYAAAQDILDQRK